MPICRGPYCTKCQFLGSLWVSQFTKNYRVQKRWHHKNFFLHFSILDTMYRWSMMKNIHSPNLVGIGSWGPEIWLHEYLSRPTEISVNWPGSSHHEPIHVKFGVWGFLITFCWNMVMKNAEMQERKFDDITLQYSISMHGIQTLAISTILVGLFSLDLLTIFLQYIHKSLISELKGQKKKKKKGKNKMICKLWKHYHVQWEVHNVWSI